MEQKSEKKVIWFVAVVIAAKLLGVDLEYVISPEVSDVATTAVQDVTKIVQDAQSDTTFGWLLAIVGGLYSVGRTTIKSIREWRKPE